jgi:hypothetical protein
VLHYLTADQMKVHVFNFLPAMCAGVHDQAVAFLCDAFLGCNLFDGQEHLSGDGLVLFTKIVVVLDMLVGDDQDVGWGNRVDIPEGGHSVIGIYRFTGDLSRNDFTEKTFRLIHLDSSYDLDHLDG